MAEVSTLNRNGLFATLAQRLEQHFCKVKVVGSNPTGGSSLQSVTYLLT